MTTTLSIGDEVTHFRATLVAVSPLFQKGRVCFVQARREGPPGIHPEIVVWTATRQTDGEWEFHDGRYISVPDGPEGAEGRARAREAWLSRIEGAMALDLGLV